MKMAAKFSIAALSLLPAAARADVCTAAVQAIAEATGALVGLRSVGSDVYVRFSHPDAQDLALHCKGPDPRRGPDVFVSHASLRPPKAYFALATKATAATLQLRPAPIRAAAQRCHQIALRDGDESGTVETRELRVECTVNKAAGQTTLTIAAALLRPY